MSHETLIQIAMMVVSAGFGWLFKILWAMVSDLKNQVQRQDNNIHRVELEIANKYVTREELTNMFDRLYTKLDIIDTKLDRKADK